MSLKRILFSLINIVSIFFCVTTRGQTVYSELRSIYENFDRNDGSALPYIRQYIEKAQKENNYMELKHAAEDDSS